MANLLVAIVTAMYLTTSVVFLFNGNKQMAIVYLGYSFSNIGLIWANMK